MDKNTYCWVPSLYFFQSIPFAMVSLISLILYKQLGLSNSRTLLITSLLTLPWSLKLFIAPFLENQKARKKLIVNLQMISALLCLMLALTMNQLYFIPLSIVIFSLLAMVSSTHDTVADALYLSSLDPKTQKSYVGIRTLFYQLGILLVKGGLLIILTPVALYYQLNSWGLFFFTVGCLASLLALYHHYQLPEQKEMAVDIVPITRLIKNVSHFSKLHFGSLGFIFFYNVSTVPMQKITPLFLLDTQGMSLSLSELGTLYGVWGMIFFLLGVLVSGFILRRFFVSQTIRGFTLLLAFGQGLFLSVIFINPTAPLIYSTVLATQLIAGLANGAYMSYLLMLSNKSQNPMSVYTLCTSLMALSGLFFGALSSVVFNFLDFKGFFLLSFMTSLILVGLTFSKVNADE